MKSSTVVLSLLASTALAQPYKQSHHRHQHKRDQSIKWVTEWAVETEVVAVTETVWVSEGFVPPTTTSSTSSSTTSNPPAQFFQPVSKAKSSPKPSPSTTTSSVYVAPPPVSTPEPKPTTTTPAPQPTEQAKAPEPVTTSSTTTPPPAPAPVPSTTSAYVAPVAPTSYAAPAQSSPASTGGSGGGSSTGECSKDSPCKGDITHYEAGLGACGWTSDGETSNVLALPHGLMGTQSNGNPYCGRKVTVTLNGKSIVAEVVDKCMGCDPTSIDLSNAAFKELEDMGVGRTQASWYFSD